MRSLSLSLLLVCSLAFAEEKGEAPPAEGEAAAGGKVMNALPKDQKEFIEKSGKLNTLTNRIVEHEKHFWEIVRKKSESKDQSEKARLIAALNDVAKDRNKDVEQYNRIKMDLKLRYPNAGVAMDRHYATQQKKSVEELEGVAGLDELLTRTKKVIDRKFKPFLEEEEKNNHGNDQKFWYA